MPRRFSTKPITNIDDPRYVRALAHPLRVRILALLAEGEASPVQLVQRLEATLGTVAYHVRTLEKLGLIEMVATHQRRGATEHVYRAREHPRFSDAAWAACNPVTKHVVVSAILSETGRRVSEAAAAGGFDRADAHFTRSALKLDEKGWAALAEATKTWLRQVQKIEDQAKARLKRTGEPPFDAGLVILLFEASSAFADEAVALAEGSGQRRRFVPRASSDPPARQRRAVRGS
ncbi:MAG TPA: winged helix-turn-helix domain-containing protein [Solirubrobacteraceae bacterium]|jgi:DNA-binding transcriptional ArsR family regulator|nr:winged helix-turn-helix domain-containing protein [Solirubrobacteraceae bacterium]